MREPDAGAADPRGAVLAMIRGQWISLAVKAAIELRVFEELDEPRGVDDLAAAVGADPPTLRRFLRALDDLGLVVRDGDRYAATEAGELLRADHPSGLRSLALLQSEPANLAAWGTLADAVRTGQATFETANGVSSWDYIASDSERSARFNAAMARRGVDQAAAIRSGCDLEGVSTIVDVGGGRGGMLVALLSAVPG